jgi:hypothetical protein
LSWQETISSSPEDIRLCGLCQEHFSESEEAR